MIIWKKIHKIVQNKTLCILIFICSFFNKPRADNSSLALQPNLMPPAEDVSVDALYKNVEKQDISKLKMNNTPNKELLGDDFNVSEDGVFQDITDNNLNSTENDLLENDLLELQLDDDKENIDSIVEEMDFSSIADNAEDLNNDAPGMNSVQNLKKQNVDFDQIDGVQPANDLDENVSLNKIDEFDNVDLDMAEMGSDVNLNTADIVGVLSAPNSWSTDSPEESLEKGGGKAAASDSLSLGKDFVSQKGDDLEVEVDFPDYSGGDGVKNVVVSENMPSLPSDVDKKKAAMAAIENKNKNLQKLIEKEKNALVTDIQNKEKEFLGNEGYDKQFKNNNNIKTKDVVDLEDNFELAIMQKKKTKSLKIPSYRSVKIMPKMLYNNNHGPNNSHLPKVVYSDDYYKSLFYSIKSGDVLLLSNLLDTVTSCEIRLKNGQTLLMVAAYYGQMQIVKLLLARGVTINSVDKNGITASDIARKSGYVEIVKLLNSFKLN